MHAPPSPPARSCSDLTRALAPALCLTRPMHEYMIGGRKKRSRVAHSPTNLADDAPPREPAPRCASPPGSKKERHERGEPTSPSSHRRVRAMRVATATSQLTPEPGYQKWSGPVRTSEIPQTGAKLAGALQESGRLPRPPPTTRAHPNPPPLFALEPSAPH